MSKLDNKNPNFSEVSQKIMQPYGKKIKSSKCGKIT